MVLKHISFIIRIYHMFENDVEMYGTQTATRPVNLTAGFENDVEMYGTQTWIARYSGDLEFENDVEMYGTQTSKPREETGSCLRMM